ncbi:hypothetical protein [Alteromonas lipolytica]|uniref:Uncharacterized protein n=1 Tax=Alteromonas lipolytica TaxID=1856405 RepID=A0A1E8FFA3_9ALTE|nr:hypothetical protein [Alteromonas lipolytica]OFI34601.1 hypothetical protein BFC17_13465 [Alteromonas lipolytica]GGF52416.1 hypothetical protein GCM10011338_00670 [Alteromonas lipolytica]
MVSSASTELAHDIVGVWDVNQQDTRLGSVFLFIHELNCALDMPGKIVLLNTNEKHQALISLFRRFSKHHIEVSDNPYAGLQTTQLLHNQIAESRTSRTGSMRYLDSLFTQGRRINPLASPAYPLKKSAKDTVIAVHLKHHLTDTQSNANQACWYAAVSNLVALFDDVQFVLIGDDVIELPFTELPRVSRIQGSVADYFAVVCAADAFAGMSSAFCAAALVGDKPYRVWKHIGHHTEIMASELNQHQQFPFALDNQRMLIAWDETDLIVSEISAMLTTMQSLRAKQGA